MLHLNMVLTPRFIFTVIFTILDIVVQSHISSDSKSHTFFHSNDDARYLVEDISVAVAKDFRSSPGVRVHNVVGDSSFDNKNNLKFFPPVLDFKERFLGVPHHEKVTIINTSRNKTVHMSSISGNTIHFHSSFFQDKFIPPLGNTTFNVVFLGRGEGYIESSLFIHTSEGSFKYQVRGESVGSPYRLRALSGVRLPLNASYSPLILMHNPHSTPLQLTEVYSSGGDFHLELPSGELEGPKHLWQIPAFLTKPIIRLKFHASSQKNHTAYIRLKVDKSGEVLVVPVEVEVGPVCGLYSPDDLIDFGIGGSEDSPKQVPLLLRNSGKKPIRVQNIITMPVSKALKIDFQPVRVPPDERHATEVAILTFDWKAALENGQTSGRIIIKSNLSGQKLLMVYTANVLPGGLSFNHINTKFRSDQVDDLFRPVSVKNNFKVPVAITNATLAPCASNYFEVRNFEPYILMPGELRELLILKIKGSGLPKDLKSESQLFVYSNISTLSIPILIYNGKLTKVIPSDMNEWGLNLGTMGSGSSNFVHFALTNQNPVPVKIVEVGSNITGANIDIISTTRGNVSAATYAATIAHFTNNTLKETIVLPGFYCVIQVSVPAGFVLGYFHGNVWITTEYEVIMTPLHMRVEHGSLRVLSNPVIFHNCFPSAVCSAEVRVESRFTLGMAVTGVSSVPHQRRLGFVPVSPPLIPPGGNTLLGHITWDMSGLETYFSANSNATGGHRWLDTLELPAHTREWDLRLLTTRYERYLNISSQLIELSLRLDTTEVRNLDFQAHIQPAWPSIAQIHSRSIKFPLTQVGNVSYKQLTVLNPASKYPIVVQLVLDPSYPLAAGLVHELPQSLRPLSYNVCCETTGQDGETVFLISIDGFLPSIIGVEPHKKSVAFILAPSSSVPIKLGFKPNNAEFSSSILMIRNNLTILETILLSGTGAHAQFKFGNRKPGSTNPLLFELVDKHLKDCENEKGHKQSVPNLTVKRSFTARNTGALPLLVTGFTINGQPCQGFGFRVLNCDPFQLLPNSTRKIDIAFTPDFTLSRITRILRVITSDSSANYTLVATLPPYLLATCSSVLSRPSWEPLLYYCAISFMIFLLVCVLAAAFFESNRILRNAIIAMSRDNAVQPILDLRMVGADLNAGPCTSNNAVPLKSDMLYKPIWNLTGQSDHDVSKERSKLMGDDSNTSGKSHLSTSAAVVKKKSDRTSYKRPCELTESLQETNSWDCVLNRVTNASQISKPIKTSICITTEPYTPLANMKSRELNSLGKNESTIKSKAEITQRVSLIDSQQKKTKKKINSNSSYVEENRKKTIETVVVQRSIEEIETSSTTSETSSNDDGDREVESMFFRSVQHHLQSRAGKSKRVKISEASPVTCSIRKPLLEKGSSSSVDNEWEPEEDILEQGTVVKNNRRPNLGRIRKQTGVNRIRNEQPSQRVKNSNGERNIKSGGRKDKQPVTKKRNEKADKHLPGAKGTMISSNNENISPPPPPPPVWTASFSDVVARSDSTYSSVVALKHLQQQPQQILKQGNITPSLEPIGAKRPLNNVWSNWSNYQEQSQPISSSQQSSANSLFTDSSTTAQAHSYENVWTDPSIMKVLQDQRLVDSPQYDPQATFNEANWPVVTSLWEPLYTPSVENPPPVWGSDVWAPPTPRSLTPPEPSSLAIQHNMEYDPFRSLSNIWAQHSPNIWKPPTSD